MYELPDLLTDDSFVVDTASDDALAERRDDLREACVSFRSEMALGTESVDLLKQGVELVKAIDLEISNRAAMENVAATTADQLVASITPVGEPTEPKPGKPSVPGKYRPRARRRTVELRNVAPGANPSDRFADESQMIDALIASARHAPAAGSMPVASIDYRSAFGDRVVGDQLDEIHALVASVVGDARQERHGLVASGGVPGPAEPRYAVPMPGSVGRPLRDAIPAFLAARGSIVFNQAPRLADVLVDQAGAAVSHMTNAQDISSTVKTVQTIPAPSPTTLTVRALPIRWQLGNQTQLFAPELVASWMHLGQTAHARLGDELLLQDLATLATQRFDDAAPKFGAYRDLRRAWMSIVDELRDRCRDYDSVIRIAVPNTAISLVIADLVAQQPGDDVTDITPAQARQAIAAWSENVQPVFFYDSASGRQLATPAGQTGLPAFENQIDLFAWIDGSLIVLDGGAIDLGIVRDSVLANTNSLQTFYESFEAVGRIGSDLIHSTLSLCPNGDSQAASTIAGVCSPKGS